MIKLTPEQLVYLAYLPKDSQRIFERAFEKEYGAGRGNAIRAKCLQCSSFDRRLIENCEECTCALHAYRPRFPRQHERQIDANVIEGQFLLIPGKEDGGIA